ncbi:MAG TPA: YciI family protein [Gaiellaceae bacterium]|nr:YciI family protein [Gaiellaceae bacterium]
MKYAILIYSSSEGPASPDEHEVYMELSARDSTYGGAQLQPVATATTVRVQHDQVLTTDGPFVETKEAFGGFYLIDVENLDDALEFAATVPAARNGGAVEVRPIVER